MACELSQVVTS